MENRGKSKGKKNAYKHGGYKSRLYTIWTNIKQRCLNINNSRYKYYGGRGITICPEWTNDYTKFRDWALNNGYKEGLEIDRRNNDENYSPENCRWVNHKINSQNRRTTKLSKENFIEIIELYNTGNYTQKELSKVFNIHFSYISKIVKGES